MCVVILILGKHGRVFSRDILKGGGILACEPVVGGSWGCSIFWKIHYYYCQSEGGEDSSQGGEDSPPTRNYPAVIVSSRF